MTSDAKIGLLLGLVFIFIIAFLINGLPSFHNSRNNNGLTTNGLGLQNNPTGLAARERKRVQEIFNPVEPVEKRPRFETPLPANSSNVKTPDEIKPGAPAHPWPAAKENESGKVKPSKAALPKTYVVVDGDNLAVIAKKFYGDEEGNKTINVTRIFQANRKVLKSPHDIPVGQKLVIPLLRDKSESVFSETLFEKVKSIGRKLTTDDPPKAPRVRRSKLYVVRKGDCLWKIAVAQLGDGTRYTEISELNAGIVEDEDDIPVGLRLKIPVR